MDNLDGIPTRNTVATMLTTKFRNMDPRANNSSISRISQNNSKLSPMKTQLTIENEQKPLTKKPHNLPRVPVFSGGTRPVDRTPKKT